MTARPKAATGSKPPNQENTPAATEPRKTGARMDNRQIGQMIAAMTSGTTGFSFMAEPYSITREGKPTLAVAAVKAATLVLLSSKVTVALFFLKETATAPADIRPISSTVINRFPFFHVWGVVWDL